MLEYFAANMWQLWAVVAVLAREYRCRKNRQRCHKRCRRQRLREPFFHFHRKVSLISVLRILSRLSARAIRSFIPNFCQTDTPYPVPCSFLPLRPDS